MAISRIAGTGKTNMDNVTTTTFAINISPSSSEHLTLAGGYIRIDGANSGLSSVQGRSATGGGGSNVGSAWSIVQSANSASDIRSAIAYLENCPSGILSVLITFINTGTFYGNWDVSRWSGVQTSSSLDQQNSSNTGPSPGSITNGAATDLVLVAGDDDDSTAGSWNAVTNFTEIFQEGDTTAHHATQVVYQIASSTGPFNPTLTYVGSAATGSGVIVSFKAAAVTDTLIPALSRRSQTFVNEVIVQI